MELSTLTLSIGALSLLNKWQKRRNAPLAMIKEELKKEDDAKISVLPIITLEEISWHDNLNDCWLVICDYVYDLTNFVWNHPGGEDVLLEYAGRDATLPFVGCGHSEAAKRILEKYLIGELPISERIFRTENGIKIGDVLE